MAEPSTIARPYAEAVFRLADHGKKLGPWSEMLTALAQVGGDPQVREAIRNPALSAPKAAGMVIGILSGRLDAEADNFVRVLAENRRLELLPEIRSQFEALKDNREGTVEAEVTSAFPLSDAQLGEIVAQLEKKTGRKVRTTVRVDAELIGGARVAIGDKVFDASARAQLQALQTALKG